MATRRAHPRELTPWHAVELVIIIALAATPRIFILGFELFDFRALAEVFSSWIIWVGGWILAPWATITYMMLWGVESQALSGLEWVVVGLAFLLDVYTWAALLRR
jgi:hypothetical protein